jgi:predicted  nucleic acid-binding Zn-ribbon protein
LSEKISDLLNLVEKNIMRKAAEVSVLRKNEKLKKIEEVFQEVAESCESMQKELLRVEHDRKKIEDSVALNNEKIKKNESKLFSGTITSSKELVNYQDEIKQFKQNNDTLESKELELMFEHDTLKPKLAQMEIKKADVGNQLKAVKDEVEEKAIVVDEKLSVLKKRRKEVLAKIPKELTGKYDELRVKKGGVALGVLKNRVCDACRMEISSGEADKIKDASKIYKCPMCNRMLIIYDEKMDSIKAEVETL